MTGYVNSVGNRILVGGSFSLAELPRLTAAMHNLITSKGYQDLELDFSSCMLATHVSMLGVVARSQAYWSEGVDIKLILPSNEVTKRLFLNMNWAHFIDPHSYRPSSYRGYIALPTIKFSNGDEQHAAVSRIIHSVMTALFNFSRNDLRAIEWAINEISDNVINHAQSSVGGFIQVSSFTRNSKAVEFAVSDAGIGIPASLRTGNADLRTDAEALDQAIREGVTRDKNFGQGNGLYGSWRIAQISGGIFEILSGYSHLHSSPNDGLRINNTQIPYNGTLVASRIQYSSPVDLTDALVFKGTKHEPVDLIEAVYETDAEGNVEFALAKEASGFGSRQAGEPIRKRLLNLSRLTQTNRITVDFTGIPIVSSSFADEVFGKIFAELGPIKFVQQFSFRNVDPLVQQLIDKAVTQRLKA